MPDASWTEALPAEIRALPNHHWVKFYVDGGLVMSPRGGRSVIGTYWSMRCEEFDYQPVIKRYRNMVRGTNNDAEWFALRSALTYAVEHHPRWPIVIYSDSQLVVKQFTGVFRTKVERHHRYRSECLALAAQLRFVILVWRPREVMVQKLGH